MSNSASNIDLISQAQASKEVTANAFFDAASQSTLYGRRQSTCSGLTWGYYGGNLLINGAISQVGNATIILTASATNYIELNPATGVLVKNTTGWTAGYVPIYNVVTGAASVTSYSDYRLAVPDIAPSRRSIAMSDANYTITYQDARARILEFTGTLTAARNIVIPLGAKDYIVFNNTTGGFSLTFIGASGTGVAIAATKRATIYADGTNVVRATADV